MSCKDPSFDRAGDTPSHHSSTPVPAAMSPCHCDELPRRMDPRFRVIRSPEGVRREVLCPPTTAAQGVLTNYLGRFPGLGVSPTEGIRSSTEPTADSTGLTTACGELGSARIVPFSPSPPGTGVSTVIWTPRVEERDVLLARVLHAPDACWARPKPVSADEKRRRAPASMSCRGPSVDRAGDTPSHHSSTPVPAAMSPCHCDELPRRMDPRFRVIRSPEGVRERSSMRSESPRARGSEQLFRTFSAPRRVPHRSGSFLHRKRG